MCYFSSNRGKHQYEADKDSLREEGTYKAMPRAAMATLLSALEREKTAAAFTIDAIGRQLSWRATVEDGCLSIGCRKFNKTQTKALRKWAFARRVED